jgi:hypothetical protein
MHAFLSSRLFARMAGDARWLPLSDLEKVGPGSPGNRPRTILQMT